MSLLFILFSLFLEKEFELRTLRDKNKEQLNEAEKEVNRLRQREVELKVYMATEYNRCYK